MFDEQKGPSIEELIADDDVDCLAYMGWQVDQTARKQCEVELERVEGLLATESLVLTAEDEREFLEQCTQVYASTGALAVCEPMWIKVCGMCVCV